MEQKLSSTLLPLLMVFLNLFGAYRLEMQLLQIITSQLESIGLELRSSLMNLPVEIAKKLTKILVISMEVPMLLPLMEAELLL